jgi:hypothetical protein
MSWGQSYISVPRPVAISSQHAGVSVAKVERVFIVMIVVEILVPRTVRDEYAELLSFGTSATQTLGFCGGDAHAHGKKGRKGKGAERKFVRNWRRARTWTSGVGILQFFRNRVDAMERLGVFQDQYAESMRSIVSDISHNVRTVH